MADDEALPAVVVNRARELKEELETQYEGMSVRGKMALLLKVYLLLTENLDILPENIQTMYERMAPKMPGVGEGNARDMDSVYGKLLLITSELSELPTIPEPPPVEPPPPAPTSGGKKRSTISKKFDKCVKSVRRTVKARRGSNKESAAIAICTTSVLHPRKRTIKRYRKGRLTTQRRKRGGA